MILRVLLILALAVTFAGCDTPKKKKDKKPPRHDMEDESGDTSFQAFVGRLTKAAEMHDLQTMSTMMTNNFGYRLEPVGEGEGVFQYWDQNNVWPDLIAMLHQKFVPKGDFMVAPPEFGMDTEPPYTGYRAGMRIVNGSWKFAYFVKD